MDEQQVLLVCILLLILGMLIYVRLWRSMLD